MTLSNSEVWGIIIALGIGTYLIRLSFLGLIGGRVLPKFILRLLRYTPVAIMPGLVAPLILWPDATGGEPDLARLAAAAMTLAAGIWTRSILWAVAAGLGTLYLGLWLTG